MEELEDRYLFNMDPDDYEWGDSPDDWFDDDDCDDREDDWWDDEDDEPDWRDY